MSEDLKKNSHFLLGKKGEFFRWEKNMCANIVWALWWTRVKDTKTQAPWGPRYEWATLAGGLEAGACRGGGGSAHSVSKGQPLINLQEPEEKDNKPRSGFRLPNSGRTNLSTSQLLVRGLTCPNSLPMVGRVDKLPRVWQNHFPFILMRGTAFCHCPSCLVCFSSRPLHAHVGF